MNYLIEAEKTVIKLLDAGNPQGIRLKSVM